MLQNGAKRIKPEQSEANNNKVEQNNAKRSKPKQALRKQLKKNENTHSRIHANN